MKLPVKLLFFTAALAFYSAEALVYWPGAEKGSSGRPFAASELPGMRQKPLLVEKVTVNGVKLDLEIYQLNSTLDLVAAAIAKRFQPAHSRRGNDFLRVIFKTGKTSTERWLFLDAGKGHPLTAFRLTPEVVIPAPVSWPRELPPLPPGTRMNMVMELPRLNAVYGSFDQLENSAVQTLVSYSARLAAAGWSAAGAEHSPAARGTGDIYIKNDTVRQVLWINFSDAGCGSFYLKKITKQN